jgi:hypothetical protein
MWTIVVIIPMIVVLYLLLRKQKEIVGRVFRSVASALLMGLAREYRINTAPYPDSNTYRMVLNGVIMVRE